MTAISVPELRTARSSQEFDLLHQIRRSRLLASTVLNGGTLRSIAAAAGMMTAFGASPALAQCFSGTGGNIAGAGCTVTVATGNASTAVGFNANATGTDATAYGSDAL